MVMINLDFLSHMQLIFCNEIKYDVIFVKLMWHSCFVFSFISSFFLKDQCEGELLQH